jgi:hypothetical protein
MTQSPGGVDDIGGEQWQGLIHSFGGAADFGWLASSQQTSCVLLVKPTGEAQIYSPLCFGFI